MAYTKKKWIDHITDANGNIIQQGTPLSASNLNNIENGLANAHIEAGNASAAIRDAIPSGMVKFSTLDYTYMKTNPNKIKLIGGGTAYVNGWKVDIPDGTIIDGGPPPETGERDDLYFLELWKDQYTDTVGEKINSRIRVVQGVDFSKFSEGFHVSNTNWVGTEVCAQGGNTTPTTASSKDLIRMFCSVGLGNSDDTIRNLTLKDPGLYVAGDGTQTSKDLLKTADGYSYAIPLFKVKRRNSGGYSVNNPNGSMNLINITNNSGINIYNTTVADITVDQDTYDLLAVNDKARLINGGYSPSSYGFIVVAKKANNVISVQGNMLSSSNYFSAGISWPMLVDRLTPATYLAANIIDDRDILDLRHQVSLTGFNYQQLLEENFDKLLRGELQTLARKKMLKTYHGIPKTPIDANHLFYASLDGTTTAEVGGALTLGTGSYTAMPTGLGYKFNGDSATPLTLAGLSASEGTIDVWANFDDIVINSANKTCLLQFLNANGYRGAEVSCTGGTSPMLFFSTFNGEGTTVAAKSISKAIALKGLHHIRATWSHATNTCKLYLDGIMVSSATYASTDMLQPASVLVGNGRYNTVSPNSYGHKGTLADISISNIDRGATFATLPADFVAGYARIDKAFNGQRKTHSDALTSQYTTGLAKGAGSGHSKGLTVTQATPGTWASGDTIKVKGLAGSIISGVIDSDTALARVVQSSSGSVGTVYVDDVSKFTVGDTFKFFNPILSWVSVDKTISAIDTTNKTITWNVGGNETVYDYYLIFETTASTSVPVAKFMNAGTLTAVTGTWTNLGTSEATFTLGTNASLVNADIQIEYSLNMAAGQGGIPEVYTATLAGEAKGKKLIVGTVAVRDDLKNKAVGDGLPITVKYIKNAALQVPSAFSSEVTNTDYTNMGTQGDGNTYSLSTSVNGEIPQALIAVDMVKLIEAKYGPIPSVDKAGWLRANISKLTCNTYVCGATPTGSKAYLKWFRYTDNTWQGTENNAVSTPTLLSNPIGSSISYMIDNNGMLNYVISTDASNGTVASSITIDSVSIDVEFNVKTGYDILVPENPRRDDGIANVLLVRKETKEIYAFFDAVNTDGLITYGDYVPYQDLGLTNLGYLNTISWNTYRCTLGTGSYLLYRLKTLPTQLPSAAPDYTYTNDMIAAHTVLQTLVHNKDMVYYHPTAGECAGQRLGVYVYSTKANVRGVTWSVVQNNTSASLHGYEVAALSNIKYYFLFVGLVIFNNRILLFVGRYESISGGTSLALYDIINKPLIK